jgi:methionine aminotransferase
MNISDTGVILKSKLPKVGTTIFTRMSRLAEEYKAINLSQGFPEFDCAPELQQLLCKYVDAAKNQYAPMAGILSLRESISEKAYAASGVTYHPETEITVTSGATEALYVAISTVVHAGDEVIVFEPAYDSYVPAIEMNGGIPVFVTLSPLYEQIDWNQVAALFTDKTRAIIINTPHNPTGKVWSAADMKALGELATKHDVVVISDEVYEHIIFDKNQHVSASSIPSLADRTFVCSSFGKTFHITGWKVGYCLASKSMMEEFRKIHQYIVFSVNTPAQFALADYLAEPAHYLELSAFYEAKRNLFVDAISGTGLIVRPSEGSFFQNVYYGNLSGEQDLDLAERLTREAGIASIPLSAFYHSHSDFSVLRFCFAKNDDTLLKGAELLHQVKW